VRVTQTLSSQQLNQLLNKAANSGKVCRIRDVVVANPNNFLSRLQLEPDQVVLFERVDFQGVLFEELDSVTIDFVDCRFSNGIPFCNLERCQFNFSGKTITLFPLVFKKCDGFTLQSVGLTGTPAAFECIKEGFKPGFAFEDSDDISITFMSIASKFSLQLWNCEVRTNNLNNNNFGLLQLRSVSFRMEIRLKNSTFENIELDNISAPWIDANPSAFKAINFIDRGNGSASKTFLELSKLYTVMRKPKEAIDMFIHARNLEAEFVNRKLEAEIGSSKNWKQKGEIRLRIILNKLSHVLLNRFFKRFYSPGAVALTGIAVIGGFATIYHGSSFASGNSLIVLDWPSSLYFSAITFCTVGYGDISPVAAMRFFSSLEGLVGIVSAALFSLCLAKRFGL
jgi:hypothetical protein